jgi:uncharacterized membrane protein
MRVPPRVAIISPSIMHDILLAPHILAGVVALASMIVPLVVRKGSRLHRRVGWVFVIAMSGVSVTAVALAIWRFARADAQHPNAHAIGFFLFYVATLTAAGVSSGVRALRFKARTTPHRNAWDLGISGANVAMGLATLVYGVIDHRTLFIAFSFVGLITGTGQLRYWLSSPTTHGHWWLAHMGGMLGSCIAALTALVVVNAAWFGTRTFATAIWIAVPAVGIPALFAWTAFYRRRFASRPPTELP